MNLNVDFLVTYMHTVARWLELSLPSIIGRNAHAVYCTSVEKEIAQIKEKLPSQTPAMIHTNASAEGIPHVMELIERWRGQIWQEWTSET